MILLHAALVVAEDSKLASDLTKAAVAETSPAGNAEPGGFTQFVSDLGDLLCRGLQTFEATQTVGHLPLLVLTELLSALLVLLPREEGRALRQRLLAPDPTAQSTGLINRIIGAMTCLCGGPDGATRALQGHNDDPDGLLNPLLQLLGNIMFGCPQAQDELRTCGGLFRVLSLCHTNVSQPLRREWAVLCLRNACEGNMENQRSIEELTLQKVDIVNEDLRRSGLHVDFNQDTGKIDFSYKS